MKVNIEINLNSLHNITSELSRALMMLSGKILSSGTIPSEVLLPLTGQRDIISIGTITVSHEDT